MLVFSNVQVKEDATSSVHRIDVFTSADGKELSERLARQDILPKAVGVAFRIVSVNDGETLRIVCGQSNTVIWATDRRHFGEHADALRFGVEKLKELLKESFNGWEVLY